MYRSASRSALDKIEKSLGKAIVKIVRVRLQSGKRPPQNDHQVRQLGAILASAREKAANNRGF